MSKHTPTPWEIYGSRGFFDIRSYNKDGFILISEVAASSDINTITPTVEDAHHIVKCVNNYDRLIEALREAADLVESMDRDRFGDYGMGDYPGSEEADEIRALVNKLDTKGEK